jgi:hypothetical protein
VAGACLEHHVLHQVAGRLAVAGQHDGVPQPPSSATAKSSNSAPAARSSMSI